MQQRHTDRHQYFSELAHTSKKYFIPYIEGFLDMNHPLDILEIGCGEGGNLLPFAQRGNDVVGIDISSNRINEAISFFEEEHTAAKFICADILKFNDYRNHFDLIICHDVIEHIGNKKELLDKIGYLLKPSGILFISFPAWQMPFGGHQQICHSRWLSKLPYIHLLPNGIYRRLLSSGGEKEDCIKELISIKSSGTTIEHFENLVSHSDFKIIDRRLYLINPHYEIKFGLKPRLLPKLLSNLPYLRDFLSMSCFYLLQKI